MCDRSRWKPRAYCYSKKKIKSVTTTKWERQIPKEEDYWNQFCQQQGTKLIVRNSYPNLSYSSIADEHPFNPDRVIRNNSNAINIDNFVKRLVYERKPLAKPKFNIPSITFESFPKETDINSVGELVLPTIAVSSPISSETSTKIFHRCEKECKEIFSEQISSGREYSSQFCMNDQNAVSEDIRNRKMYSRRNCPVHRNEPHTPIFDDYIDRYLAESNRKEANPEKEIIRKNGKLLLAKNSCKICQKNMNECTSTSITDFTNDIKLPDNLNSNIGSPTLVLKIQKLDHSENECSLKSIDNRLDDIKLLNDLYSNRGNSILVPEIKKLNDTTSEPSSSKCLIDNLNGPRLVLNSHAKTRDIRVSTAQKLSISKTKSENFTTELPKHIKRRRGSSTDNVYQKYSHKYAYRALKCVTPKKELRFDSTTHETGKKISPRSENREKESANVSTSLRSQINFDYKLEDRLINRSNSSANFLNELPKLSYLPRKTRDRCLSCLYNTVDKIVESKINETYKPTKRRTTMQTLSVDTDGSHVTLSELKDNGNKIVDYVNIANGGVVLDENEIPSYEMQKVKKEAPELEKPLTEEVEETKERPTELKLKLESPIDKKNIDLMSTSVLSEKSKISSIYSSSDEDKSSGVYLEDSSKTSKYRAPCHVPTILCPTLEPLKALKMRKSTPLQARITLDVSTIGDSKNVQSTTSKAKQQEKLTSKDSTNEMLPVKKHLAKVKSVSENLIAKSEDISKKKERVLRRGSSCVNLERILRDFARGTKLDSIVEDNSEKSLVPRYLFSTKAIEKILNDLEQQNSSTINMLRTLCDIFLNRALESNKMDEKRSKIIKRLMKLLVDSRRYLYPSKFPDELIFFSSKFIPNQRPLLNPERLRNILPLDSYNLIAPLLGMPEYYPRMPFAFHRTQGPIPPARKHRSDKSDSSEETGDDLIVHPPSVMVDTIMHDQLEASRLNPYSLFFKKERRKVITWRPLAEEDLRGYDPEATLRMRADKVTMKICEDFCKWLRSLGGAERDIDETVLKDMFEISFSADACKATQISVKEMATVPMDVASARLCHGSSVLAMTRKQLHRDAEAEEKPKRIMAFGTFMPTDLLFLPPNNRVRQKWLECKNVPRDLETMDTVWNGITDLDSVQGFLKWIKNYSEIGLPDALTKTTKEKRRIRQKM